MPLALSELFNRNSAWLTGMILLGSMLAAWAGGWWLGRRRAARGQSDAGRVGDASLALMGLLLGFTFAIALQKHDQRRGSIVTDANAIGDFATCVEMLDDPLRAQLKTVLRQYVQFRLDAASRVETSAADLDRTVARINDMQARMTELVRQAIHSGTPVAVPLVNTLNEVTSSHAARLASYRDRLPWSIVLLLAVATIVSIGLLGRAQGIEGRRHAVSTSGFILLVGFALYLTLDLNQPRRGLIRVSQEPMQRLLKTMEP